MDSGLAETQFLLDSMEYQVNQVYKQAQEELEEKIKKFYKDFNRLDTQMMKKLSDGKITKEQYDTWRRNKIFNGKVWEQRKDVITKDLYNAHDIAQSIIYGYMPEVYAVNHNFATYQIEQDARVDTSYTLYSHETVERLLDENPELIPYRKLNREKFDSWTKKNIQAVMLQGVLQGESINHIAKRLARTVSEKDRKCAIRDARTMTTGAMNGGKYRAILRAKSMGIDVKIQWKATFDDRTRDSHRAMDGEVVEVGQSFSNGLRFPVDLHELESGKEIKVERFGIICRETYNCRCYIKGKYKGLEPRAEKLRSDKAVGIPYEEWKKGHKSANEWREKHGLLKHDRKGNEIIPKKPQPMRPKSKIQPFEPVKPKTPVKAPVKAPESVKNIVHSDAFNKLEESIKRYGDIASVEVKKLTKKLTENDIIQRLCGGDKTEGSCSSLAYAYIANKMGYDVLDFRGGDSREFFSMSYNIEKIGKLQGIDRMVFEVKKEASGVAKKLKELDLPYGKEYRLGCGKHASIIRNTEKGYEYLELQSGVYNGWKPFETEKQTMAQTLNKRFGCVKGQRTFLGRKCNSDFELTVVDSYANVENDDFIGLMKYLNTSEEKQKKGKGGHER